MAEILTASGNRKRVIDDSCVIIDEEVDSKGGLTGMALKAGFAVVKRLDGGTMLPKAVDSLLDEFVDAMEPFYDRFAEAGSSGKFDEYLRRRDDELAEALLSITDARERRAKHAVLKKTYNKLRPAAKKHVQAAIPRVSRMVQKYLSEHERKHGA